MKKNNRMVVVKNKVGRFRYAPEKAKDLEEKGVCTIETENNESTDDAADDAPKKRGRPKAKTATITSDETHKE